MLAPGVRGRGHQPRGAELIRQRHERLGGHLRQPYPPPGGQPVAGRNGQLQPLVAEQLPADLLWQPGPRAGQDQVDIPAQQLVRDLLRQPLVQLELRLTAAPYHLSVFAASLVFGVYPLGSASCAVAGRLAERLGRPVVVLAGGLFATAGVAVSLALPLPVVILGIATITAGFFAAHGINVLSKVTPAA